MRKFVVCLFLSSIFYAIAFSEEQLDSIENAYVLNEMVVTGTLTPKSLKSTPVQTRLISEQDLHCADAADLHDLLQQELPGIEFSYAMNQQVSMNFAGFAGLSVLVLVDGERLAGETMDNIDFSRLPMANVQRIEIIRGAASALYGSNAAGGVINIITKRPKEGLDSNLGLRGGSHGLWRGNASMGINISRFSNMLDCNYNRMSAYDVCLDVNDDCDYRKVFAYRTLNVDDRLRYDVSDDLQLAARLGYYFKQRESNVDIPDRYRAFSGSLRCLWSISDVQNLEVHYAFDQYDKSDFIRAYHLDIRDYCNVQHSAKILFNQFFRNSDILTIGADFMNDMLTSYQFEDGGTFSQCVMDAFAQYDLSVNDNLELVGAVRGDWFSDNSTGCITPKLSARYIVGKATLRGGYSGGFRAPSLKERHMLFDMADIFDIHGNPDLMPEKSHNFNLSAEYAWRNYYFMIGGNYNLIKNKIGTSGIFYDLDDNPYIQYLNVKDLYVINGEANIRASWLCGISTSLGYNFTYEQSHSLNFSQYCPARPHAINLRVSWHKAWLERYDTDVSLSGRFLSSVSYSTIFMHQPFEERKIINPAYTLWKLQISQHICKAIQFTCAIDNLLNYQPKIYTFNAPVTTGTTFQIGLNIDLDK